MEGKIDNEVKYDFGASADSSNVENTSYISVNGNEREDVPATMAASDHDEENCKEPPTEEEATPEPYEKKGKELNVVNEQAKSQKESVVFEINSHDEDGAPRLPLEALERQNTTLEEKKAGGEQSCSEDLSSEECMCEDRDTASQRCSLLQGKLAEFFHKKARDDSQVDVVIQVSKELQEYEKYITILTDLKQQLTTNTETSQKQAEELRFISQEKLDKVENEWQSLVALKQEVAVTVLSLHLGKQAAQTKVETALETEKLLQHELIRLRLKNIKLRANIHRLEGELVAREKDAGDPLLLHFDLLQAERLELKKHTEKQNEESLKTQLKISSSLELLSNIKEKLFWSQMEAQAKREQLAMLEATVARGTDFLTRTRHARNSLRRDNLQLREHRGLLGNRVLLLDFEDTVDASDYMEDQLRDLKCRQAEIVFSCGRWKKKLRQPN
ncbi:LOW QUALITY PROTEIN: coiled-coil domain-containing protein 96 [Trematomus bernacchii]|uniref:LOW QUALITY PROTEIN: coiled-coil domain-containing protein 96 n=1 Tax=Trematomus bernacchii TaxID=40690 RepID=UPI00146F5305|nr:LOW QUALITY PROTEIN: coiled-coil domain-containing protein 96 [Trematomus bernacchii]